MSDPTGAPPPGSDAANVNELLDAARVPLAVSVAAAALAGAGLIVGLVGLQNLTLVTWLGNYVAMPWTLLVAGAAALFVASKLMHARRGSLAAGLAVSIVLAVGSVVFLVLASAAGLFTPLAVLGIVGGIAAVVLVAVAIPPFRRLAALRRRLRDAGFDVDL